MFVCSNFDLLAFKILIKKKSRTIFCIDFINFVHLTFWKINQSKLIKRRKCIFRAGTREVHNKLEKNRRAHLKECFEQLKKNLPQMQDEKKTSNLSILGNACRHVQVN